MSSHESERLCAYLDGELPPDERGEVEAHLAACPACAALLADMTAVDTAATSLPADPPEGYFEAFPSRVVARLGAASGASARTRRLPAWTWAAAAALLLAVVAPLTLRTPAPGSASPSAPAPVAPRTALEDRDQKVARDALSTPAAAAVPAARPRPFASPPAVAQPAPPGAPAVTEGRFAAGKAARNEAVSEEVRVPLPPQAAPAGEGVLSRSKGKDVPAESEVRQEPAPVTAESVAAPEGARGAPARRSAAVAAAPMASTGTRDETAAGALSVPEPERAFGRLEAWHPTTAAQWRRLRDAWRGFVAVYPDGPRVDEARVRAIEAAREAWLAGGDDDDEAAFQREARAYLEREDAVQKERVERLLVPARRP